MRSLRFVSFMRANVERIELGDAELRLIVHHPIDVGQRAVRLRVDDHAGRRLVELLHEPIIGAGRAA